MNKPIVIDGAQGEGGGQIFRSCLTLAMCLGKSVRIENIRAGRRKPGLLRQHLTCLRAATNISNACVSGAELGSQTVSFAPGEVRAGNYRFAIGSAGSTTLVFQTVVLPLLFARQASTLVLEGGTHNGMAPSYDFIAESYLPVLQAMGCKVTVSIQRHGFYPQGGGAWQAHIQAEEGCMRKAKPVNLAEPGNLLAQHAVATTAHLPTHVGERELDQVRRKGLWGNGTAEHAEVEAFGPGNILSLRLRFEKVCNVFEAQGERHVSAERVAGNAMRAMRKWQQSNASVEPHLADQLLLPLLLGPGGCFTTNTVSQHLLTNINVIREMTGVDISLNEESDGKHLLAVPRLLQ